MVNVSILRYALGWQVINFLEDARQIGTCVTHRMTESARIKKSKKILGVKLLIITMMHMCMRR